MFKTTAFKAMWLNFTGRRVENERRTRQGAALKRLSHGERIIVHWERKRCRTCERKFETRAGRYGEERKGEVFYGYQGGSRVLFNDKINFHLLVHVSCVLQSLSMGHCDIILYQPIIITIPLRNKLTGNFPIWHYTCVNYDFYCFVKKTCIFVCHGKSDKFV